MREIEVGHIYEVDNLGHPGKQRIEFVKESNGSIDYGDDVHPGTNTQEVTRVLIARSKELYRIRPCDETGNAIYFFRMALFEYEARAWRRKQKKINKKGIDHPDQDVSAHRDCYNDVPFSEFEIELLPVDTDGHVIPKEK